MHKALTSVLGPAALALATSAGCRPAGPSAPTPLTADANARRFANEAEVGRLEQAFARSHLTQDAATYARLMSDGFRGVTAMGTTHDKAHDLDAISKPGFRCDVYTITDLATTSFADDAVMATFVVNQKWAATDSVWNGDYAVSDVWRREADGQWRLFRSHWTKVDRGPFKP